jgi:uncharacterized membrane protein YqjE
MAPPEQSSPGPFESLRRLLAEVAGVVRNRVELFGVELQEERHRHIEILFLAGAAAVLAFLGLLLFSVVFILLFAEPYRIYAAGGLGLACVSGAAALVFRLKRWLRVPPFAETIAQVKKDFECLTPPP